MEYKLTFLKGCPFVDYGEGQMFVDLGLSFSIADKRSIRFDGAARPVPQACGPISTSVLSDWFEVPVAGAIGCDLLLQTPIKIDYKAGRLVTHYDGPAGEAIGGILSGRPAVDLSIDGSRCRCFIDTGAQYSYLLPGLVEGKAILESVEDCKWGAAGNRFQAALFNTAFACNGIEYKVGCGALDPMLVPQMEQWGTSGVIGKDFFDHHAIVIEDGAVYANKVTKPE